MGILDWLADANHSTKGKAKRNSQSKASIFQLQKKIKSVLFQPNVSIVPKIMNKFCVEKNSAHMTGNNCANTSRSAGWFPSSKNGDCGLLPRSLTPNN